MFNDSVNHLKTNLFLEIHLFYTQGTELMGTKAGSPRIKKNAAQKRPAREIATFNYLPWDKEIATLHFTSLSLMSWFSRFCLEVGQPQLLAIHLACDSFPKRDKLHWQRRNNSLNFCLMNLVSEFFQNFAR